MKTRIVVHPGFEKIWPVSADRLRQLLAPATDVDLIRAAKAPAGSDQVERLCWLGGSLGGAELAGYPALREAFSTLGFGSDPATDALLDERGIRRITHPSEGYWAQSVSEFELGLTIARCAESRNAPGRCSTDRVPAGSTKPTN